MPPHDDEIRASLAAIGRALSPAGLFAFETRNPLVREWETWSERVLDVGDANGRRVRVSYEVEPADEGVVTLAAITSDADGNELRVDRASLRFLDVAALDRLLGEAGFELESRYGEWDGTRFAPGSREVVTLARVAGGTSPPPR